jgi:ABC-type uncharacterized transport system ATPase subunit
LYLQKQPKGIFIDKVAGQKLAEDRIKSFNIRGTPLSTVESLSGGNQQRAELALLQSPLSLVLLEHPTRGLDIESVIYIWSKLKERCKQGASIIFISSDLEEILQYSDRVLVFFSGKVSPPIDAATTSVEQLGQLIGGKGWPEKGGKLMLKGRLSGFVFQFLAFVLALGFVSLILIAGKPLQWKPLRI